MALDARTLTELIRLLAGPRRTSPAWLRPVVQALQQGNVSRLPRRTQQALEDLGQQLLLPRTSAGSAPPPGEPPADEPAAATPDPGRRHPRTRQPQGFPEEQQNFSDEFLTPTSSNVYSFQYYRPPGDSGRAGQTKGILYVTYKANEIRAKYGDPPSGMFGATRSTGSRKQLHGERGSTVGKKLNKPGPTYAYFDVPISVFKGMKDAYSKGHYVWETLRVEHSVYGHRYRYLLVVGQIVKRRGGGLSQYVPRKAGRKGFVTRSVSDIGTGRRGFVTSTLHAPKTGTGYRTHGARGGLRKLS